MNIEQEIIKYIYGPDYEGEPYKGNMNLKLDTLTSIVTKIVKEVQEEQIKLCAKEARTTIGSNGYATFNIIDEHSILNCKRIIE